MTRERAEQLAWEWAGPGAPDQVQLADLILSVTAEEREACARVVDESHAQWCKNCDRPQSEHSGPSYAAAVAGAAATRDCAAAIRDRAQQEDK